MSSYKIPFVSITGNSYEIRIYPTDEGYNANTAIQLTGAAEPIVTEEDNSTDIMTPVRSSTGYLRIVTDDYTLQSKLMPINTDEMRVTLLRYPKADETDQSIHTEWEGYIQPNTYTQDWCAGPWEIELPIISHLGMMMDAYLSDGNTGLLTVGAWLARICGNVYKRVLLPSDSLLQSSTMQWGEDTLPTPTALQLAFSEELFKSPIALAEREDVTDTTSGIWNPQTNRDIASSLSAVFRWVIREAGDTLICDDPGTSAVAYKAFTPAQLLSDNPQSTESELLSLLSVDELGKQWADARLGGADGTMEVLLPYSRVSIESTTGEYSETIINPTDKAWQQASGIPYTNGAPDNHNRPDDIPSSTTTAKVQKVLDNAEMESFQYFAYDFSLQGANVMAGQRVQELIGNERTSMAYVNFFPRVALGSYGSSLSANGQDVVGGGEICAAHYYQVKEGVDAFVHYKQNGILLGKIYTNDNTLRPAIRLRCSNAHLLPYSSGTKRFVALRISGKATWGANYASPEASKEFGDNIYAVKASVKIGNYYLTKDTWGSHACSLSTSEAPFDILWMKDDKGEIKEYLRVPIPEGFPMTLDAPIEVTLYTPSNSPRPSGQNVDNAYKYLRIDNFEVSICRQQDDDRYDTSEMIVPDIDTSIKLSHRLHDNKLEEYSLRTAFAGPDNPGALIADIPVTIAGVATSLFPARKIGSLEGDSDGARYLCRRTFEFLKIQGKHIRHCITLPLQTLRPWGWPTVSRINYNAESYFPAAVKHQWRNDIITATLIELKYE